jgi:hypothetical protein
MITQDAEQNTINQDAQDRANELDISSYPTAEFDGGYYEVVGGQNDDSNYVEAIETCNDREGPDLYIDLSAQHSGGAEIDIDVEITNSGSESYSGTLRVYIVEIVSRYFDYDGNHYPYGFLDFAIDTSVSVSGGDSESKYTTWDGAAVIDGLGNDFSDINPDNIIVYATLMNSETTSLRDRIPQSSKILNLHLLDQTAAAYLTEAPEKDNDPPEIKIISPADSSEVSGTVRIEAQVTDESSITKVEFQLDSQGIWTSMFDDEFNDYFRFWETKYVADGQHIITVRAFDSRNNIGTDYINVEVKNDYEDPEIKFKNLDNDEVINDVYTIEVQATDDMGVKSVQYRIDSGDWNNMVFKGSNEYSLELDTTTMEDGEHDITVKAEDNSGKTVAEVITFNIRNKAETPEKTGTPGFEGVLLISCVILVLFFFYYQEDHKQR